MDNGSLASVSAAIATVLTYSNKKINILIANASINENEELIATEYSYEILFTMNQLSYFLLLQLLKPTFLTSSTPDFYLRAILTSSATY